MIRFVCSLSFVLALACSEEPEAIEPAPETTEEPAAEPAAAERQAPVEQPEEIAPLTATVGETAPDFTLTDQAGTQHTLRDYRGKIVVLEWINPDCPYVQRHYRAQTMRNLVSAFEGREVAWLAIDSSHFVTPESSQEWREEHELPYPILQDASGDTGRSYNARTTPNMYVVDAQGVLRYTGAIDDDPRGRNDSPRNYVREVVDALLEGNDPPMTQTEPYGCSVKYENT